MEASKRLEHFLDLTTEVLDESLVLDAQTLLCQTVRLLFDSRLLFVHYSLKDGALVIFRLHFLCFQIYDLPELVHRIAAREDLSKDLTGKLL